MSLSAMLRYRAVFDDLVSDAARPAAAAERSGRHGNISVRERFSPEADGPRTLSSVLERGTAFEKPHLEISGWGFFCAELHAHPA